MYIYEIIVDGVRRYVGQTNNIKRRQSQHIREYKKEGNKYLYRMIRENSPDTIISLNIIKEVESKLEANRLEAYLILMDYYGDKQLWQSIPFSVKYF
jgi:predicted GIY-YIG superfamily endonuclease